MRRVKASLARSHIATALMVVGAFALHGAPAYAQADPDPADSDRAVLAADIGEHIIAAQQKLAEGDPESAIAALDTAMSLRFLAPDELGVVLYLSGRAHYETGDVTRAASDWSRALAEGELPQAQRDAIETSLERLESYLQDEEARSGANAPANTPEALTREAITAAAAGDFDHAIELYGRAAALFGEDGKHALEAGVRLAQAGMLGFRERYDEARAQYEAARSLAHAAGEDRLEARIIHAQGELNSRLGDYEEAEGFYREAVAIAETSGTPAELGRMRMRLADALMALSAYDEAQAIYEQALDDAEAAQQPALIEGVVVSVALNAWLNGDIAAADGYLDRMQEDATTAGADDLGAKRMESAAAWAHTIDKDAAGCWLESKARALYAQLGRADDADDMRAIMEDAGCSALDAEN